MGEEKKQMLPLILVSPGKDVILKAISGGRQIKSRLTDMGLVQGLQFRVVQNFGPGPCIISIGNSRIALGHGISEKIFVVEKN